MPLDGDEPTYGEHRRCAQPELPPRLGVGSRAAWPKDAGGRAERLDTPDGTAGQTSEAIAKLGRDEPEVGA